MASPQQSAARARAVAARVITRVLIDNRYLDSALDEARPGWRSEDGTAFALIQELAYGTLRWYHQLARITQLFISRPFKAKDSDVYALLLVGIYQLRHMRVPDYAAVDATVRAADTLEKSWAKSVLNACLRAYQREAQRVEKVLASDESRYSHPAWLIERVREQYPTDWTCVLEAANARPPMTLRVNALRTSREQYLTTLQANDIPARAHEGVETAVVVEKPVAVERLPDFAQGHVSVQDAAAQLAATYLDARPGQRVLDACAAPGGKAAHVLERTPTVQELTAIDVDAARIERVRETFLRLGLQAQIFAADAIEPAGWWNGQPYDRVLLDAPCSATGVIRRHPDIKVRREAGDLPKLCATQQRLLESLWPCLARGGKLLYATCSILRDENDDQVRNFIARHNDATIEPLSGNGTSLGHQILPGENDMDGFYYACLRKT